MGVRPTPRQLDFLLLKKNLNLNLSINTKKQDLALQNDNKISNMHIIF